MGQIAELDAHDNLSVGGAPYNSDYPGTMAKLPGDAGFVGLRTNSQGIATVDVNLPGEFGVLRLHYK